VKISPAKRTGYSLAATPSCWLAVAYMPSGNTSIQADGSYFGRRRERSHSVPVAVASTTARQVASSHSATAAAVIGGRAAATAGTPRMLRMCAAASTLIDAAPIAIQ
jgi:hypothetical protein